MSDSQIEDLLGIEDDPFKAAAAERSVLRVRQDSTNDDVPLLNPAECYHDEASPLCEGGIEVGIREDHCHVAVKNDGDKRAVRQLIVVSCFCTVFMLAEIVGGLLAKSLAIATDATHLACDLAGFVISLFAIWISRKPPTKRLSFGFYRAEVMGALASVLIIWAVTAVLVYLAIERIRDNAFEIEANAMMITAGIGVAFNLIMALVLHGAGCHIKSSFGHGHSHGGPGHGHSHGGSGHGHSHGGHGHSHGGHSHGDNGHGHEGHGHSNVGHGHSNVGHSHSNVGRHSNVGHGHSHGGHDSSHSHHEGHGHSHGDHSHDNETSCSAAQPNGFTRQNLTADSVENRNKTTAAPGEFMNVSSDDSLTLVTSDQHEHVHMPRLNRRPGHQGEVNVRQPPRGHDHTPTNINVRAAMIHVIGDLIQSIGVFVAAIVIKVKPDWKLADPICTFVFSVLVLFTTINVLKDIVMIMMQATPRDINYDKMKADLKDIEGVQAVHSLNVWSLTMDKIAVGVHLAIATDISSDKVLKTATAVLRNSYNASHTTIQVELYELAMRDCSMCNNP